MLDKMLPCYLYLGGSMVAAAEARAILSALSQAFHSHWLVFIDIFLQLPPTFSRMMPAMGLFDAQVRFDAARNLLG